MIINNIKSIVNQDVIGQYSENVYMIMFDEAKIFRSKEE